MAEVFDVFISYRRKGGQELARALYSYLDGKGLRVFLDEVKLQTGDYFDTQLREKLISAPHYVLIGTNDAFNYREGEDWVREEALLAVEEHEKAPSERTLTVLVPYDAVLPDKLPGKLDRILKAQRIPMPFGAAHEDNCEKTQQASP